MITPVPTCTLLGNARHDTRPPRISRVWAAMLCRAAQCVRAFTGPWASLALAALLTASCAACGRHCHVCHADELPRGGDDPARMWYRGVLHPPLPNSPTLTLDVVGAHGLSVLGQQQTLRFMPPTSPMGDVEGDVKVAMQVQAGASADAAGLGGPPRPGCPLGRVEHFERAHALVGGPG